MDAGHCRIERVENFYYGLPDRREEEAGMNRDGTMGSRDERRRPESSSRRRSRSLGKDPQPPELLAGTPLQQQIQLEDHRRHTSSYISPFDDGHAVDENNYTIGNEESSDKSYGSAPTHITLAGRGHRGERDSGGRRDRSAEPEPFKDNQEDSSTGRGNNAANQQLRPSIHTSGLSERERRPSAYHSQPPLVVAPPPVQYHSRPAPAGMTSQQRHPERLAATTIATSRDRLPPLAAPHAPSRDPPPAYQTYDFHGLPERQRDHGNGSRGTTSAPEEYWIGNAYATSCGRQERRVSFTQGKRHPGNPQLPDSSHRQCLSSSAVATPQRQSQHQEQERTRRRSAAAATSLRPSPNEANTSRPRREGDVSTNAANTGSGPRTPRDDVLTEYDRKRPTTSSEVEPPAYTREARVEGGKKNERGVGKNGGKTSHDSDYKKWKNKYKGRNIKWIWFLGVEIVPGKKDGRKGKKEKKEGKRKG